MTPYTLTSFNQDSEFRVFAFTRQNDSKSIRYTVKADLSLALKHHIPIQELPLLCRGLLERSSGSPDIRNLTFGENEMRAYAQELATRKEAALIARRQPSRTRFNRTRT